MIITCPKCKKKFQIDTSLIPDEGRDLQCGSCQHLWFFNKDNEDSSPLTLDKEFFNKNFEDNLLNKDFDKANKKKEIVTDNNIRNNINKSKKFSDKEKAGIKKKSTSNKFFSYLIVLIISFVALVILVDTLKIPIIKVFPGLEIVLFNLIETLKDIKLFIIDLY